MKDPLVKKKQRRKNRFSDYEQSQAREFRKWVYPDGTKMTKSQIEAKLWMSKLKEFSP